MRVTLLIYKSGLDILLEHLLFVFLPIVDLCNYLQLWQKEASGPDLKKKKNKKNQALDRNSLGMKEVGNSFADGNGTNL